MTIENEKSILISNEQLVDDIRLAGLELDAYQKLADGFSILAGLPENCESGRSSMYWFEVDKYKHLESECAQFLNNLYQLKSERGI